MTPTSSGQVRRWLAWGGLVVMLSGCAGQPLTAREAQPEKMLGAPSVAPPAPSAAVLPARQGRPARSSRIRFVPASLTLPGGATAEVAPVQTVDGQLKVPENVRHVGWWDGSSYAGDPFGTTVIAGHVDSATEGIGFFARLLRIHVKDQVVLRGETHRATYRVSSVRQVPRQSLAADSRAFDATGDHRLVLITCAGTYNRERGGYANNLVVTAVPVGSAR